ncbi:MAG: hypothetical protein M5U14_14105 [Acidimicrobiia bacterium]|nr:hypothetical protein [Acidimicrobiia bacterium]
MCRHLAYLGPPVALADLLLDAPHALARQARYPRHQVHGHDDPDGYGVGWYEGERVEPLRHRAIRPIWEDDDLRHLAGRVRSGSVLAAARLASPGSPIEIGGNAPFASGPWLFSLNGIVDGFHGGAGTALRASLGPDRAGDFEGSSDTEVVFALALEHLDAGATPGEALRAAVARVLAVTSARLNLLLTDGNRLAATALGSSLFRRTAPGLALVASEPLDEDPGWRPVGDGSLLEGGRDGVCVSAL